MRTVVSFVVEMPDDQAGDAFHDACQAVRLTFAFAGMKASKARVEMQTASNIKPLPKVNAPGPAPVRGRPS